ncbi:hypothetical protein Clacol_005807 [Clathrus columnatus]|uniref:Uncharacterized protein n=1 Tax=Clathrus columnatus TaxID=1419009 RepID=A0AAV5ACZ9_9AGAM|nr:hypothetical protein Clacol_005807 [Clathrus columnatus]
MSQTRSGSLKSPTFEEEMSSQSYQDDIPDETLVSDDTLKDGESDTTTPTEPDTDLDSFVPLRRCGTPCSAPPRFYTISDTDRPCLIKRCSSFTSLEDLGIFRNSIHQCLLFDEEDTESFDNETQEDCIYFPRVNDVYVEDRNPWCIMPINRPRPPRPKPRQRYEVKETDPQQIRVDVASTSHPSTMSSDVERTLGSENTSSCTLISIPYVDIEEEDLDILCPPQPIASDNSIQDCPNDSTCDEINVGEEKEEIGMIPITQPYFIPPSRNSNYYTNILPQTFRPKDIPILECSPSGSFSMAKPTSLRRSKQIVTDSIRRYVEFDLQSAKQNRKTWFEMTMEDEELEEECSY